MSKYVDGVNEENMDLFLTALRSGEFEQGTGRLRGGNQFCCLGVASEVASRHGVVEGTDTDGFWRYDGQNMFAPGAVAQWLGIPEQNIEPEGDADSACNIKFFDSGHVVSHDADYVTATELNDDRNDTFNEIADVFENEFRKDV